MKFATLSLLLFATGLAFAQKPTQPKKAPQVNSVKTEIKEIPLNDADADKFLLAVEKANHAADNITAAFMIWKSTPEVAPLFANKDTQDKALEATAAELLKKAGLDITKYYVDGSLHTLSL